MTIDHYLRLVWGGPFLTILPSAQSAAAGGEEREARASSAVVFRVGWISHSASCTDVRQRSANVILDRA
jgi:hypothetical protein